MVRCSWLRFLKDNVVNSRVVAFLPQRDPWSCPSPLILRPGTQLVVKQRMQLYGSNFRSPFSCFFHIFRNEGLRALYISYPTTLAMSIPFQSVQFTTYEHCKAWFNPEGGYNPASHVFAGAVAGGTASLLTNVG